MPREIFVLNIGIDGRRETFDVAIQGLDDEIRKVVGTMGGGPSSVIKIVNTLPASGDPDVFYAVPKTDPDGHPYVSLNIWLDGKWTDTGDFTPSVDLSPILQRIASLESNKADKKIPADIANIAALSADGNLDDTGIHRTDVALKSVIQPQLDTLTAGLANKYVKDPNGIPATDLAGSVQDSLKKADTALQAETDPTVADWAKKGQPTPPRTPDAIGAATAAQGAKADTAVQSVDLAKGATPGTLHIVQDGTAKTDVDLGLGTAAFHADTDYVHPTDSDYTALKAQSNDNQNKIGTLTQRVDINTVAIANAYSKPTTGIPKSDLSASVQASLSKADAAAPLVDYSTTEQKTGEKWIDGKDIYIKTFSGTSNATANNVATYKTVTGVVPGFETMVELREVVYNKTEGQYQPQGNNEDGSWIDIYVKNNGDLQINQLSYDSNRFVGTKVVVVIKYTKK